jgi:hypothetical protein
MKHVSVALTLVLAIGGLAACGDDKPATPSAGSNSSTAAAAPSPSKPAPKEVLTAAAESLDTTSYDFAIKQTDISGQGTLDPATKSLAVNITGKLEGTSIALSYLAVAPDLWMKADLGAAANTQLGLNKTKWMLIDKSKVTDKSQLPVDEAGNPAIGTSDMLKSVSDVKQTDATHFTGTVDVTDAGSLLSPDADVLKKVGDKAKAVPFSATIDDKGRLTDFKTDGASIDPALTLEISFSNFGATKPIAKPTGAVPAPANVYKFFS